MQNPKGGQGRFSPIPPFFKGGRGGVLSLLAVLALVFAALFARPVRITSDDRTETVLLWAWQSGKVRFTNSVTHGPVAMDFGIPWHFSHFSARTDSETESYYTAGAYSWNERLAKEDRRDLQWCSEVGIGLALGGKNFEIKDGCLEARLVWPP